MEELREAGTRDGLFLVMLALLLLSNIASTAAMVHLRHSVRAFIKTLNDRQDSDHFALVMLLRAFEAGIRAFREESDPYKR